MNEVDAHQVMDVGVLVCVCLQHVVVVLVALQQTSCTPIFLCALLADWLQGLRITQEADADTGYGEDGMMMEVIVAVYGCRRGCGKLRCCKRIHVGRALGFQVAG